MNADRQPTIGRLERQKAALIRRIEALPQKWLTFKPAPAVWSVLEVLDHVRKTELAVLHSSEVRLKTHLNSVTPLERLKAIALIVMMQLPIKLKVPEAVSFVRPNHVTSLQAVLDSWATDRLLLREFLRTFTTADENAGLVFHPAVGWMNLRTTLRFLSAHLRHHDYQLQRIRKACERAALLGEIGGDTFMG